MQFYFSRSTSNDYVLKMLLKLVQWFLRCFGNRCAHTHRHAFQWQEITRDDARYLHSAHGVHDKQRHDIKPADAAQWMQQNQRV